MRTNYKDLIGKKVNKLYILSKNEELSKKKGRTFLLCKCDCGDVVSINMSRIVNETTRSCGCLQIEATKGIVSQKNRDPKYNKVRNNKRIWRIWYGMIKRCYDKTSTSYKNYGDRGIRVCDTWRGEDGLNNFYDWALLNGYNDNLSIERRNVNGNYEPENCEWADDVKQGRNKRNNITIYYNGRNIQLITLLEELNRSNDYHLIYDRIKKYNMSIDDALNKPIGLKKQKMDKFKKFLYDNFSNANTGLEIDLNTVYELSNISRPTFRNYLKEEEIIDIFRELNIVKEYGKLVKK